MHAHFSFITAKMCSVTPLFQALTGIGETTKVSGGIAKQVSGGIAKQDITIANSTGVIKLTLWEADIGQVTEDNSYCFKNMMVRSYNDLSMPKDGGSITQCDDIGEVADDDHGLHDTTIKAAEVAAVIKLIPTQHALHARAKFNEILTSWGAVPNVTQYAMLIQMHTTDECKTCDR